MPAIGTPRFHPNGGTVSAARDKVVNSQGLPIHNANHPSYSRKVAQTAEGVLDELEATYGSLDKIPGVELTNAAKAIEKRMHQIISSWAREHGDTLK